MEIIQPFLQGDSLDADNVEMLYILGVAFAPSVIGLVLAFFAVRLPDDGYALSQPLNERQREHQHAHNDEPDWRRAA